VDIVTDLQLAGPVGQYGRGLLQDVSSQLVDQFAECLKKQLAADAREAAAAVTAQARPIGGLRLGVAALWRSFAFSNAAETPDNLANDERASPRQKPRHHPLRRSRRLHVAQPRDEGLSGNAPAAGEAQLAASAGPFC
jgi:hypothetical protein